jgi:hypothetical protein
LGFISVAFKSISFHPHYSSLVLNASLKAGIYSVAMFHKNNHTVRCGYFYGYRERFYMLRRNKVALRQGFGQNVCTAQKRRQPEGRLGALSEPFAGSENIQIGVQFHKNRSFRLKRAALFLGEKEPPAILVGFPHML